MDSEKLDSWLDEIRQMVAVGPGLRAKQVVTSEKTLPCGEVVTCMLTAQYLGLGSTKYHTRFKIGDTIASRATVIQRLNGESADFSVNEALREAFEAQAPEIALSYTAHITRAYEHQRTIRGPSLRVTTVFDTAYLFLRESIYPVCDATYEPGTGHRQKVAAYTLNPEKLQKVADAHGHEAALDWFYKTNMKLGKLDAAEVVSRSGGSICVKGFRSGKLVLLEQQRVLKESKKGRLFHQYPARLYVDGQFFSAIDFHKMFRLLEAGADANKPKEQEETHEIEHSEAPQG